MSVLGTTVFQVPKLGQTGFQIDQVNEQKRKQAQQQLEKEVAATGADKAYAENAYGLTGIYKQVADAQYQVFKQAAIEYEKTGSSTSKSKMQEAASKLTYDVTAGRTILGNANDEYLKNKSNGFKDVALDPTEASELYTGFVNRTGDVQIIDGVVVVKDGDNYIPAEQSTYLQSSVNLNNSMMLPRVVKQGTFVDYRTFVDKQRPAIAEGVSEADAMSRVEELFRIQLKDKDFFADVITAYGRDNLKMVKDPSKISAEEYAEIQGLAQDEETVANAVEWYRKQVMESVPPLYGATRKTGTSGIGYGTSKDIMFIENETISTSPIKKEGDKYVIDPDAEVVDITFDAYSRFQGNLQGKSYTDAKQFQYDIVGIGVKDGKIYADKESSEQESGFFASDGRQYKRKAEPMTRGEFTGLPTDTRNLLIQRFGSEEIVMSMLGEKASEGGELD